MTTAANLTRDVDVVVHTHWDREWYLPYTPSVARLRLVMSEVLDQLDSGVLPFFLFDGQTAALEDLLTGASAELKQRLHHHAAAGRLVLGPWYVMADEFLVSGESLLRNLEMGLSDASALGPAQRLGYLPDSFGHCAQMPAVLAQFGIHQAVLWRGADAHSNVFNWVAPSGDVANTVFLPEGYYLHALNQPDGLKELPALLGRIAARTPHGPMLLMQGGDHLVPSPHIAARISLFNAQQTAFRLRQTTLAAHVQAALAACAQAALTAPGASGASGTPGAWTALPADAAANLAEPREVLHGELRHNRMAFVLPDVLSTRRGLKRAHQEAEDRLLGETEPLLAQLGVQGADAELRAAWRTLVQQQAHDSICGCSVDAVHSEMAQRFVSLAQSLDALRNTALVAGGLITRHQHTALDKLNVFADDSQCTLFNPLPQTRSGWWLVSVFLHGARHAGLAVTDRAGQTVRHQVLSVAPHGELVSPLDDFPDRKEGHLYEVAVQATLPGLGALALTVSPQAEDPHPSPLPQAGEGAMPANLTMPLPLPLTLPLSLSRLRERAGVRAVADPPTTPSTITNAHWHIHLDDQGNLVATQVSTGQQHSDFLSLLSELDAGDSYNFSPPPHAHTTHATGFTLVSRQHSAHHQEMTLARVMQLPASLAHDRQGASAERVDLPVLVRLRLFEGDPALHLALHWDQTAKDHPCACCCPSPVVTARTATQPSPSRAAA